MKHWLAAFGVLVASVPAFAQTPCGLPGVTVDVSPPVAAPGQVVTVTLTNNSSQVIQLPSTCVFLAVHPDAACSTNPVSTSICFFVLVPIAPGQSVSADWDQRDDGGQQVPSGAYSFDVRYWDAGFTTLVNCCAPLDIASSCAAASAQTRNGSGANPLTLASVNPPRLGASWDASLDCSAHAPGLAFVLVFDSPSTGPLTPFGEILVSGSRLLRKIQPHTGSSSAFTEPVPADLALCGLQTYAQGVCFGAPGPQLSNALDLVLGS